MKEIAILDFHGILYFHDKSMNIIDSDKRWEECIGGFRKNGDDRNELDIEWDAVKTGSLELFFVPNARNKVTALLNRYKIVTASSSRVLEQQFVLKRLLGTGSDTTETEYNAFSNYGNKEEPQAWLGLLEKYLDIDIALLYEDKEKNLDAAKSALQTLGMKNTVCRFAL